MLQTHAARCRCCNMSAAASNTPGSRPKLCRELVRARQARPYPSGIYPSDLLRKHEPPPIRSSYSPMSLTLARRGQQFNGWAVAGQISATKELADSATSHIKELASQDYDVQGETGLAEVCDRLQSLRAHNASKNRRPPLACDVSCFLGHRRDDARAEVREVLSTVVGRWMRD